MSLTLTIQGWFYVLTGIWPLVHMKSFEMITGPKKDKWLVRTVALMITCSGVIFISFNESKAALALAIMNALCLAYVDIYFSFKEIISKIYLLDAVVELGFVAFLIYFWA